MSSNYESWGRYPKSTSSAQKAFWISDLNKFIKLNLAESISSLPRGLGRSYGDSCLNNSGKLIDCTGLNRFISFDEQTGILCAESGVTLGSIQREFVPRGWTLPTTPGTQFVTLGGAVANDIHGKNHHFAGSFGCHIESICLLRSDCRIYKCSRNENAELFFATIGGLGLTGIIVTVTIKLSKCTSAYITQTSIPINSLEETLRLLNDYENDFEHIVCWLDLLNYSEPQNIKGILLLGNQANNQNLHTSSAEILKNIPVAKLAKHLFYLPAMRFHNYYYYYRNLYRSNIQAISYEKFFYPLDNISNWNQLYGEKGFLQYQFVVPQTSAIQTIFQILEILRKTNQQIYLAVLKQFGNISSGGYLSFAMPGITLAIDLPLKGESTLRALEECDQILLTHGGRVYPAKDARVSAKSYQQFYPQIFEFERYRDPYFSSTFWERVYSL
jgi:FAD/FMN-containing dehydrogenase